ncbi:MAG: protease pro-enzyme activation domain-containing protein [Acidobacteriota bacterium]
MNAHVRRPLFALVIVFALVAAVAPGVQAARTHGGSPLVIDNSQTVVLPGNVYPLARPEYDAGPASPSLPMDRMILALKMSGEKRAALKKLLAEQQDPSSPLYHQWLTPQEFGARFGADPSVLAATESWLRSQGFRIDSVAKGGLWINFSGDVQSVERTFHTRIHEYLVKGNWYHANDRDPSIPVALGPYVWGIVSLNDFPRKAMHTPFRPVEPSQITPEYTSSTGNHYLAPADFATIYDLTPLYSSGINGGGAAIAIVGRTHPSTLLTDWSSFRSNFGLSTGTLNVIVNGTDPGDLGQNEDFEADLDVEWSGAVAPQATIDFVISASTNTADGVDLSAQYIVDNNIAPIMSTSFGLCEADLGSAGNDFYDNLWMQAAAQGITSLVAAGDNGAAGCDNASAKTGTAVAVSGLASTPYDVCVGGTLFMDSSDPAQYWSTTNNPTTFGSALSYIPEAAWNESGASTTCPTGDTCSNLYATGGGASTLYSKPAWQVSPGVPADGMRDIPDVALNAATYDGYIVASGGKLYIAGGTSASSPSFAGIMALVVQKTAERQGNANVRLYQLGNAQYTGSGPVVFNDVTTGDNSVPGVTGFSCGPGYDQATGLGSVDGAALVNAWSASNCSTINLSPSSLPNGAPGTAYSQSLTASGGTAPYTFVVSSGPLPSGLSLGADGVLSGTPTADGTSGFDITVTDSRGCRGLGSYVLALVNPPVISGVKKAPNPFRLIVKGSNLQYGIQVLINGSPYSDVKWKNTGKLVIKGGKSLKSLVPKGATTSFTFINPDQGTVTYSWSW